MSILKVADALCALGYDFKYEDGPLGQMIAVYAPDGERISAHGGGEPTDRAARALQAATDHRAKAVRS